MKINLEKPSTQEQLEQKQETDSALLEKVEQAAEQIEQISESLEAGEQEQEFDNNGSSCGRGHGCMGSMWCGRQRP